jgi:hypothetical protein
MSRLSPDPSDDEERPHPIDIVRDILRGVESLPALMEIYYLVNEPGLLEIMRGLGALSDDDRSRLQAYLSRHSNSPLRVRELSGGALSLEPTASQPMRGVDGGEG